MERKENIEIDGITFTADDHNNLFFSEDWWPENNTAVYYLEDSKFQALLEGEILGDYTFPSAAIEAISEYIVTNYKHQYEETTMAECSNRILSGSTDQGYDEEWIGYGELNGCKVRAIYMIDYETQGKEMDMYDWDKALTMFETDYED
jgi:hypothetical protein